MSVLKLDAENINGKTVITHCEFTSPLKIMNPFYHEDFTEICMMAASAGMLEGDFYDIEINVKENTSLKFTEQSYLKIFKSDTLGSTQNVKITVGDGGTFYYLPKPIIPFSGSIYKSNISIYLSEKSRLVMTDIFSCGRVHMNECFGFESFCSRKEIFVGDKLCVLDNQRYIPKEFPLETAGFFEGHTHTGFMYEYGFVDTDEKILSTEAHKGKIFRMFSDSAQKIENAFNDITENDFMQKKQLTTDSY